MLLLTRLKALKARQEEMRGWDGQPGITLSPTICSADITRPAGTRLQVIDFEAMPVGWTREKFVPACDQGGLFNGGAQGGIYGGQNPMPGPNTSASPETYHW